MWSDEGELPRPVDRWVHLPVTAVQLVDLFRPSPGHAMGCWAPYPVTEPCVLFERELYFFSIIECMLITEKYGKEEGERFHSQTTPVNTL